MSSDSSIHPDLHALADAAVEGQLTDEQRVRLEAIVLHDAAARRWYVAYLHQHACLHWAREAAEAMPAPRRRPRLGQRLRWASVGFALAAALGLAVWFGLSPSKPPAFATIIDEKSCRWENGSLPTAIGARLPAGRLQLAEGLARLRFDSGAELALEAPAELEIVSASRCILQNGRLVAKVPPAAIGFVVETPTAELIDQGTEFGVHVGDVAGADVQVFEGQVDVRHRSTGRLESLRTGKSVRVAADALKEYDGRTEQAPSTTAPAPARDVITLTTAAGRGKDAYIQKVPSEDHRSDILLLVKHNPLSDWNRKAYLGFDLSPLGRRRVTDAALTLTFAPTEIGFASEVLDATFTLYGMTDDKRDNWPEVDLPWSKAPGNAEGGAGLRPENTVRLGSFIIEQGQLRGTRTVGGPALVDFLNADRNGLATLILVRETAGSGRKCLVHGFASRRHPSLPPPTLKLELAPH